MILDIIVLKSDDGFTAEIPSLKGCETWHADEEILLTEIISLAKYYLNLADDSKVKIDKASVKNNQSHYKLIIDKNL
ncbi:MAG: hypothetical protein Q8N03_13680 [Ignavibacteria bacterium]|jgi:predicted RNase H-like HicB family nuclease|nr:hypothetical protein [Ignavibacteria bacterium]